MEHHNSDDYLFCFFTVASEIQGLRTVEIKKVTRLERHTKGDWLETFTETELYS